LTRPVRIGDTITLHYRLTREDGKVVDDSFADGEALTLTLGSGALEPRLERWLVGLNPGQREVFMLEPALAFGERDESLIQNVDRTDLGTDVEFVPGTWMEFSLPNGQHLSGRVLESGSERVKVDFNHPLAGWGVTLEVEVLKIIPLSQRERGQG
jgi:FKBP-type peptidyl-prolyl cis-trans isomerase 2